MKRARILLCCMLILTLASLTVNVFSAETASPVTSAKDLSRYFSGYDGCFVLYDQNEDIYTIYNEEKSRTAVSPCSTFKLLHTLIGLECGAVKDENTLFQWDGTKYPVPEWNQDLTLASAMKYSGFWYYQRIAESVGEEQEQAYLDAVHYGNKDLSGGLTQFWQQSSLKISPWEQVEVLKKIYANDVPFSRANVDILKKIIRLSQQEGAVLSGKTGSGMQSSKFIQSTGNEYVNGWFVGYVEKEDNVFFFATNIASDKNATGMKAKEITLSILHDQGIFTK